MSDLVRLPDGSLIDAETGEIVEDAEPFTEPSDRLAYFTAQFLEAKAQAEAWELQRKALARTVTDMGSHQGLKHLDVPDVRVTLVANSWVKQAKAEDVLKAIDVELMTHEDAAELLIAAARTLDVKAVEAWIEDQDETVRTRLRSMLLSGYERKGYPLVRPALKDGLRALVSRGN